MSKDIGAKNHKKSHEDKTSGKTKAVSDYKSESKSSGSKATVIEAFNVKSDNKTSKTSKKSR